MKRVSVFIACFVIIIFTFSTSYASSPSIQYSEIHSISCSLIVSGNSGKCSGKISPFSANNKASLSITLQKKNPNGTWSYVKSWSASGGVGDTVHISENWTLTSGNTYRVYAYGTIMNDGGELLESGSAVSTEKTI